MLTDQTLLQQFVTDRSAEAFHEIVQRYAGMVFGAALRVTADRAAAEDVAQDCFFKLTQKADQVRDSLPGWLHQAALNRAREVSRSEAARRRREQAAAVRPDAADEPGAAWEDVAPLVDAALAELPGELRDPLVEHYLCGQPQRAVAERLGVNQGTVSRRIDKGITQVRRHLREAGVAVPSVGALATLLTTNAAGAAPPTLVAALGKITLAGATGAAATTTAAASAGGIGAAVLGSKAGLTIAALLLLAAAIVIPTVITRNPGGNPMTATHVSLAAGETLTLAGHTYTLTWLKPGDLDEAPLPDNGALLRATDDLPYRDGMDPLYNLHVELNPQGHTQELAERLGREADAWRNHWRGLADALPADRPFALLAYEDGKLAGMVRFYPADAAHLIGHEEQPANQPRASLLLVGAAMVDPLGAEHGLDAALLQRVVRFARESGYRGVQGVGWSESRVFAAWGQQLPASVYEAAGFRRAAQHRSDRGNAFRDQLAGAHGEAAQRLAQADADAGLTAEQANTHHLMAITLTPASARREDGRVWIDDIHYARSLESNGYVRGFEALLAARGTPVSYERLMGLSGMAFITQVDTEHRWEGVLDAGWWPLDPIGLDLRKGFVARAIGYELEEYGQPFNVDAWADLNDRLPQQYQQTIRGPLERAINAGHPVLTLWCGTKQEFGYVIYGYDQATDKPAIWGLCARSTEGELGRCDDWPWGVVILGEQTEPMDADAADIAALRYAARLIRDEVDTASTGRKNRWLTGQEGYAFWAALLRNMDEPVQNRHHWNMRNNLIWQRRTAVAYLNEVATRWDGGAAEALTQAAGAYERVMDGLHALQPGGLGGSPDARRAMADQIDQIASLEREAAQHIERAVVAMAVKREDDRVWIDGVEGFGADLFASSMHGSQARILETLGESLTYDDLVGYSAFAFRVGFASDLCPSAGHPACGYQCLDSRALPWSTQIYESFPWSQARADPAAFEAEVRAAVKASIDRGIPVRYISEEEGLIIGYADGGERWWCIHPYHHNGKEAFWHDEAKGFAGGKWPWGVVVWRESKPVDQRVPDRELTLAALRQAVEMWRQPGLIGERENGAGYYCGDAAYDFWLGWLRGIDDGTVDDPKAGMQGNGWCFDVLAQNRRIAGRWLAAKAQTFEGEARERLLVAADHYGKIAERCMEGLDCPWDLALPPGRFGDWTAEMRRDQIARLETAREHDRAAVAAIEQALNALGATP